MNKNLLTL